MRLVGEANKYLSDTAPWKLKNADPERMASVLHTTLQVVDDVKTLITPFLPSTSQKVHEALGGTGSWAAMPELVRGRRADRGRLAVLLGADRRLPDRGPLGSRADRGRPAAPILTAVAWPYANGPRHIGHVAGFGVPSDVFSRYHRMAGNNVLMVSGTDEHGTPIQVQAERRASRRASSPTATAW